MIDYVAKRKAFDFRRSQNHDTFFASQTQIRLKVLRDLKKSCSKKKKIGLFVVIEAATVENKEQRYTFLGISDEVYLNYLLTTQICISP